MKTKALDHALLRSTLHGCGINAGTHVSFVYCVSLPSFGRVAEELPYSPQTTSFASPPLCVD